MAFRKAFIGRRLDVGSLGVASGWGLFDMHGNVWEWCEDVWHDSYGKEHGKPPDDGSAWITGGNQSKRVLRGGGWMHGSRNCRSATRVGFAPGDLGNDMGFRVVMAARTP